MIAERMEPVGLGPLAAALAKAQAAFPNIPRNREVTVSLKTGGSYKFKYAPLDTILSAVRAPLSANGLAISQMLEGPDLVTVLLHESGAHLQGSVPLPHSNGDTVQQLGSAITYLRRYALQAILGIASDDDDDGNAASGNKATTTAPPPAPYATDPGGLIGVAKVGKKDSDANWDLKVADGGHVLVFKIEDGNTAWKTVARTPIAEALAEHREAIEGQRVTAWGTIAPESFTPPGARKAITYNVLTLTRIETPAGAFPVPANASSSAPLDETAEDFEGVWGGPLDEPK